MKKATSCIGGCLLFALGCGETAPPAPQKPASAFDYAAPASTTQTPVQPAAPPTPTTEQVRAEVGVGKKGHGYGGGIITEPVHQYFVAKERIAFEIQLPEAIKLYKALHDDKGPRTHEEFMKEIVEAGAVTLPQLPEGHRYVYDPKTEELMVERPTDSNQTEK